MDICGGDGPMVACSVMVKIVLGDDVRGNIAEDPHHYYVEGDLKLQS